MSGVGEPGECCRCGGELDRNPFYCFGCWTNGIPGEFDSPDEYETEAETVSVCAHCRMPEPDTDHWDHCPNVRMVNGTPIPIDLGIALGEKELEDLELDDAAPTQQSDLEGFAQ